MTLRDSSDRNPSRKVKRSFLNRLRSKLRRKERRLLTESLEQRQLLAGPNLVAIQHDESSLLSDGMVLDSSPRELVFRFNELESIDPSSIASGIQILGSGINETGYASALSDLGTNGETIIEFRAVERGIAGDGIEIRLDAVDFGVNGARVLISVDQSARQISLTLNSNPGNEATVRDIIFGLRDDENASSLVECVQVSGSSLATLGDALSQGVEVVLASASSAQVSTDFGTQGQASVRFVSTSKSADGASRTLKFTRLPLNLSEGQLPYVTVSGDRIDVILDSTPGKQSTIKNAVDAINLNAQASSLVRAEIEFGNPSTPIEDISFSPVSLLPATNRIVEPGYVGLGDSSHEVVFRFSEPLPQDQYSIQVLGSGGDALLNIDGEPFADGQDFLMDFSVNAAPQVAAVVPTPVRRQSDGTLVLEEDVIEVHFSEPMANAGERKFYELIYTGDTAGTLDDERKFPTSVVYAEGSRVAVLRFESPLSEIGGSVRLRVGSARVDLSALPLPPAHVSPETVSFPGDPSDSFEEALAENPADQTSISGKLNQGSGETTSIVIAEKIQNKEDEYELDFPGGKDMPGIRSIRQDDPTRLELAVPLDVWRKDADSVNGISTVYYEFPETWRGDDPSTGVPGEGDLGKTYFNIITDQQKDRVREAFSTFSQYLGVQFIETNFVPPETLDNPASVYMAVAVGELYGSGFSTFESSEVGGVTVASRPLDKDGNTFTFEDPEADTKRDSGNNLLVMDFQDFSASTDDQLGGKFFRGAMLGVGQLLGYGYADHLPQPVTQSTASVLSPTLDNESLFPSPSDIVNGQYLYRPESNDIDLYNFTIENAGKVSIQTNAERLQSASNLNTVLRLYQRNQDGKWIEIAANDDYFGKDSLIELDLPAGDYMVGVSASGNNTYDPAISGTGFGGLSEGDYELNITLRTESQSGDRLTDISDRALDGDMSGEEGGDFNYWFLPSSQANTIFVDSRSSATGNGSLLNPFSSISDAIREASENDTIRQIRVVGGSYAVGLDQLGIPLDAASLDIPQGVQLLVDAGTTFRMRASQLSVGSSSENVDRSGGSIQLLGLPDNPVVFTSAAISPAAGDWGGIHIRNDFDASDTSRVNPENNGVFLNHFQFADIRYGGGPVPIEGVQTVVSSVELNGVRPTIMNSTISNSADAAIGATPSSMIETRFDEFRYQREEEGGFVPDYQRIGPHLRGNRLVDNTVNGLLFRIETPSGGELETLRGNARLDDIGIVHVLTENLVIEGSSGGLDASFRAPNVELVLINEDPSDDGNLDAGDYAYKLTFVNRNGYETAPSDQTSVIKVDDASKIVLQNLPKITPDLEELGYVSRRIYRAFLSDEPNSEWTEFRQVKELNGSDGSFTDDYHQNDVQQNPVVGPDDVVVARPSSGLTIDPGTVLKLQGSRIELSFGAHLFAEGTSSNPITFTSTRDNRYGAGGSFETMQLGADAVQGLKGDWGGIIASFDATISLDHVNLIGAGGTTRIEGGFGSFNAIESNQANLRIANSRFDENADGRSFINDFRDPTFERVGRAENASGTVFVRGSQPVIIDNRFIDGNGPAMTFDINSFTWQEVMDQGRSTGLLEAITVFGNSGPLVAGNEIGTRAENSLDPSVPVGDPINRAYAPFDSKKENNPYDADGNLITASLLGMEVRGGEVAAGLVFDDVDIVHIVRDTIEVPNQHIYGGLRLESDARGSLVVKFQSPDSEVVDTVARRIAGIVVGGNLVTSEEQFVDIADRIGGSLQVVGHPDFPVVLTSLTDDSVGAGFTFTGDANRDTDNNGVFIDETNPLAMLPDDLVAAASGTWDGVTVREAASSENILVTNENEPQNLGNLFVNDTNRFRAKNELPSNSQFLGELANSTTAGDNLRRLGFIVEGTIAQPGDLDVFSFVAEGGTQVWLDIDRTDSRLDTIVELIDANGQVRALSNDSLREAQGLSDRYVDEANLEKDNVRDLQITKPAIGDAADYQDPYSTNPRDAGMRVVLPGALGQRNIYHVRVRSNNSNADNKARLENADYLRGGLTTGAYQLQIRLTEDDVFPGTQIRFADQRFAENGIEIIGGPLRSQLTGDDFEVNAVNDSLGTAQRLGLYETQIDAQGVWVYDRSGGNVGAANLQNVILSNPAGPLSSDQLAKSVSGFLDDATDVDWYQFDIEYPNLTKDSTVRYLSTVFDLDYVDGLARPDMSMYVFDDAGRLILIGTDSNVADDQVIVDSLTNDLLRGSYGTNDPFIGVSELNEGTYFVAVANASSVPSDLSQFFDANPSNPLLRLEPIDSVSRLIEDRLDGTYGGTNDDPLVSVLFNAESASDYTLDDVVAFFSTDTTLFAINSKTGANYLGGSTSVGSSGTVTKDLAFTLDGQLRGFDQNFGYYEVDTATGLKTRVGDLGMRFLRNAVVPNSNPPRFQTSSDRFFANAVTIRAIPHQNSMLQEGFVIGDRVGGADFVVPPMSYNDNILFRFDPDNGQADGISDDRNRPNGSGANRPEIGRIDTDVPANAALLQTVLSLTDATIVGADGVSRASIGDGDLITIRSNSQPTELLTFEFDQGFTLEAPKAFTISDGDRVTIGDKTYQFITDQYLDFEKVALRIEREPELTPVDLIDGTVIEFNDELGQQVATFKLVGEYSVDPIDEFLLRAADGTPLTLLQVIDGLAREINSQNSLFGAVVVGNDRIAFTTQPEEMTVDSGLGEPLVDISGGSGGAGTNVPIYVKSSSASDGEKVIALLADAVREEGNVVVSKGTQMSLPYLSLPQGSGGWTSSIEQFSEFKAIGYAGYNELDNVRLPLYPTDTADSIATRLERKLEEVTTNINSLDFNPSFDGVTLFRPSNSEQNVEFLGATIEYTGQSLNAAEREMAVGLSFGGSPKGGKIVGIELVETSVTERDLYAISDAGVVYVVPSSELNSPSSAGNNPSIAVVQRRSQALQGLLQRLREEQGNPGIVFSGLRAGPMIVEDGKYRFASDNFNPNRSVEDQDYSQIVLFAATNDGQVHAFSTTGDLLPIFAGGRTSIDTGITNLASIDFSTLQNNLWHLTDDKANDAGHGLSATFNGAREGQSGGTSLAFSYLRSDFQENYVGNGEAPVSVNGTYNFPGGAKGSVLSNSFSLAGYSSSDLPTLYFNYFADTEGSAGDDALRVYVATDDGIEHLVATNNRQTDTGDADDEFDDPDPTVNANYTDDIDTDVQPLFETNGGWRQVRVPLDAFAGQSNLSLRIEFSTSGTTSTTSDSIKTVSGEVLSRSSNLSFTVQDSDGNAENFTVTLADAVTVTTGKQLAAYIAAEEAAAAEAAAQGEDAPVVYPKVIVNKTQYEFQSDGVNVTHTDSELLVGSVAYPGPLSEMTSAEVATFFADEVVDVFRPDVGNGAVLPLSSQDNYSDSPVLNYAEDFEKLDDFAWRATRIPSSNFSQAAEYSGSFDHLQDVDLLRVELRREDRLSLQYVYGDSDDPSQLANGGIVTFYDERGVEVTDGIETLVTVNNERGYAYTPNTSGVYYIALSKAGGPNDYSPFDVPNLTRQVRSDRPADQYKVDIKIVKPESYKAIGTSVEFFGGHEDISASPAGLLDLEPAPVSSSSISIPVSRDWSAGRVAEAVQEALATRFMQGDRSQIPTDDSYVTMPGLSLLAEGPFVDQTSRFAMDVSYRDGLADNNHAGIYLDDFIIGFAERGELVTNASAIPPNGAFVSNGSLTLTNPIQQSNSTNKGPYQFEIRDGSEYVSSGSSATATQSVQRFEAAPVVVPVQGKPYGVANQSVPLSEIIPTSQRPPFQIYDLPTIDVRVDPISGLPLTSVANGRFEVFLQDGTPVSLIPLDGGFTPIVIQGVATATESRFRSFGTNQRMSEGLSFKTKSGDSILDGASFTILGDNGSVTFEYDVLSLSSVSDGADNGSAVLIPINQFDSASEVAAKTISAINQDSVQITLGVVGTTSSNSLSVVNALAADDSQIQLFGNVTLTTVNKPFMETETGQQFERTELRGDQNRDRTEQGVIIVENSNFSFNQANGVSIIRDALHGGLSNAAEDQFPVALVYPNNLYELNTQGLVPGAVIQNNLVAYNNDTGIYISGITDGGGAITTPVGYDQIINNTLVGGSIESGLPGTTQIYQGIAFAAGDLAFADAVVLGQTQLGEDVDFQFTDTRSLLDGPDVVGRGVEPVDGLATLSLGTGGRVVVQFTDNYLTGNDAASPDLAVFETGANESVLVEISRDGVTYFQVGIANSLSPLVDIDAFGFTSKDRFAFVRLTDLDVPFDEPTGAFGPAGADIDAVGALSSVPVDVFTPGSEGIVVENNAGPILLNNLLANFDLAVNVADVDPDPNVRTNELSKARTVIGGSAYYRNTANALGSAVTDLGSLSLLINANQPMFVNPSNLLFGPLYNTPIIDSAIDSVEDRASLATVRQAIGINPVPVLTPNVDGSGQLRVDDPNVASPLGQGQSAFKDRGAYERTDVLGPRVTLISPRADDLQRNAGQVVTVGQVFDAFEIQLIDGLLPADPSTGVGVDDTSVLDGALIKVVKTYSDARPPEVLEEGVDYRYAYDVARNTVRLTPVAGIWEDNAVYTISFLGQETGIIQGAHGYTYGDGQVTNLAFVTGVGSSTVEVRESVEMDLGISVSVSPAALNRPVPAFIPGNPISNVQGQSIEIFDGLSSEPTQFVLTTTNDPLVNENIIDSGGVPVRVAEQATAEQIAIALSKAVNKSSVMLLATAVGNRLQLRDAVIKSSELFDGDLITVSGAAAYQGVDLVLSPTLRGLSVLNQTFSVYDGVTEFQFEFVSDASESNEMVIPVVVQYDADRDEVLDAMKSAINNSGSAVKADGIGGTLKLRGQSDVVPASFRSAFAKASFRTGDPLDDAFKLSNFTLDVQLADDAVSAIFGETITIFDGQNELTFEFEDVQNPGVLPGHVPVPVAANLSPRDLVDSLKTVVEASGLNVSMTRGAKSFRLTGLLDAASVNSATDAVIVRGLGGIGTTPGFGISIPEEELQLSSAVDDGQSFRISRGPIDVVFELDLDSKQSIDGSVLIPILSTSIDAVENAVVNAINNASLALNARSIGGGQILIEGDELQNVSIDVSNSRLEQIGIAGEAVPTSLVVPLDATPYEIAIAYQESLSRVLPEGLLATATGDRVLVEDVNGNTDFTVSGTSALADRVRDKVGNEASSEDLSPAVIYMGGSFDWGDAPAPYRSSVLDGGPSHLVSESFALWTDELSGPGDPKVSFEPDAKTPDLDDDNGVRLLTSLRPGFIANFEVGIFNQDNRDFYLDAWIDWNANGVFEETEAYRFGSAGTGRSVLTNGVNVISVMVPADVDLGEIYARFRLSEIGDLGPVGVAASGEVEDVKLRVDNNPFRNPVNRYDVNNSGLTTPLDALQIVNALGRNDGNIFLDVLPLPVDLPEYPDVSGDGVVSALDSLQVINELSRIVNGQSGSGEWVEEAADAGYVPVSNGVMASMPTALSQLLGVPDAPITESNDDMQSNVVSKTSVFDDAASVQLDSIVDTLAADNAAARSQSEGDSVDDWFASL